MNISQRWQMFNINDYIKSDVDVPFSEWKDGTSYTYDDVGEFMLVDGLIKAKPLGLPESEFCFGKSNLPYNILVTKVWKECNRRK